MPKKMFNKAAKICLICSLGGHFEQMTKLRDIYSKYENFFIIPKISYRSQMKVAENRTREILDINEGRGIRNPVLFVIAFIQSLIILLKEKPTIILSTGAGIAIPSFLLAKILRIKTIYIESFARIKFPSKSGKFCYYLSDLFLIQHENLLKYYPRAKYYGSLYNNM